MADVDTMMAPNGILLYLDEIQYFNKKQQQSLLEFLENGKITLIASTTENPYFYIYNALLSRSTVLNLSLCRWRIPSLPWNGAAYRAGEEPAALYLGRGCAPHSGRRLRRRCPKGHQRRGAAVPFRQAEGWRIICDKG